MGSTVNTASLATGTMQCAVRTRRHVWEKHHCSNLRLFRKCTETCKV